MSHIGNDDRPKPGSVMGQLCVTLGQSCIPALGQLWEDSEMITGGQAWLSKVGPRLAYNAQPMLWSILLGAKNLKKFYFNQFLFFFNFFYLISFQLRCTQVQNQKLKKPIRKPKWPPFLGFTEQLLLNLLQKCNASYTLHCHSIILIRIVWQYIFWWEIEFKMK